MDKLLILGGTNFIGRNLIEELLKIDKYEISIFNRGITNPKLFPSLRKISGDRNSSDVNLILKEQWDYVIDLSCFFPDSLSKIVQAINKNIKRYIFISSCSVYDNDKVKSILRDESSPTLHCSIQEAVDTSVDSYGKRKSQCEKALQQSNLTYSIFRPALVYGKYDNTDRFYYWLYQIKSESELLIPNHGESQFSVTYVKDLVKCIIKTLNEDLKSDIYNITTFPNLSITKLIETASKILGKQSKLNFTDSEFLTRNKISEWTGLPLWLDCDYFTYNNSKIKNDLKIEFTNFESSVKETIDYYNDLGWKKPIFGISHEIKDRLIDKIKNKIV